MSSREWAGLGDASSRYFAIRSTEARTSCGARMETSSYNGSSLSASLEGDDARRVQLAAWSDNAVPVRAGCARATVRGRVQHQPVHRMPNLHDGVQVDMDVLPRPGAHVVEQRRVEAVRRVSAELGIRDPRDARPAARMGHHAVRAERSLRYVQRQDDFRGRAGGPGGPRVSPTRQGMEVPENLRGHRESI